MNVGEPTAESLERAKAWAETIYTAAGMKKIPLHSLATLIDTIGNERADKVREEERERMRGKPVQYIDGEPYGRRARDKQLLEQVSRRKDQP